MGKGKKNKRPKISIKEQTAMTVRKMIERADKGVSGFWTDDYEGCGNPGMFPEFNRGLKHGDYVTKPHLLCPWHKTVMQGGDGYNDGCYHHCGISDARYLTEEGIKKVLKRFLERMESGEYDNLGYESRLRPLLTKGEFEDIETAREAENKRICEKMAKEKEERMRKASALLEKYAGNKEAVELIEEYYGKNIVVNSDLGVIDFSPDAAAGIAHAENISYDRYLDLALKSGRKWRSSLNGFYLGYYEADFKGCVDRKSNDGKKICFSRLYVGECYSDFDYSEDKEDHVWMDTDGFDEIKEGDCVKFLAEPYCYLKNKGEKDEMLDFSLKNPYCVEKIEQYKLPTDEEMAVNFIGQVVCEACMFRDHCDRVFCMAAEGLGRIPDLILRPIASPTLRKKGKRHESRLSKIPRKRQPYARCHKLHYRNRQASMPVGRKRHAWQKRQLFHRN